MSFKWRAACAAVLILLTAAFQTANPITPQPIIPTPTATIRPSTFATLPGDDARAAVCAAHTIAGFSPHIVAPGDTIAALLNGSEAITVTQAAALNCLDDPDALPVGAVIYLPQAALFPAGTPQPCLYGWIVGVDNPGCAPTPLMTITGAIQQFEYGMMLWLADTQEIYVFLSAHTLIIYEDTFVEGNPDPTAEPPDGLFAPVRGFGIVWEALGGADGDLGWAISPETGTQVVMQPAGRLSYSTYLQMGTILYALTRYPGMERGFWINVE